MHGRGGTDHVGDLQVAYLNGTLPPAEAARAGAHIAGCPACAAELADWRAVFVVARGEVAAAPAAPAVLPRVWAVLEDAPTSSTRVGGGPLGPQGRLLWDLLRGQVPLVRRGVWAASALTMALGCLVALTAREGSGAGVALALVAPIVAAVGVAFVYGPENDPSLEVALGTPTSPRLVLLARLTLVYGYDALLALGATLALVAVRGDAAPWPLVSLWLGPMLFLSGLSLLVSLAVGPTAAMLAAMVGWTTRVVVAWPPPGGIVGEIGGGVFDAFWGAEPALAAVGVALIAVAVLGVPRQERLGAAG